MLYGREDMRKLLALSIAAIVCFGCNAVFAETVTPAGAQSDPAPPQISSGAPASAPSAKVSETARIEIPGASASIEMVLVPAGSFSMGSEKGGDDEKPVHKVTISKPFYIGACEVTQAQWEAVMGSNPSGFKGAANPVESVSWNECQEFIRKLNEKVPGGGFRLPTEAEWEYVCRAGSTTEYCNGDGEEWLGEYAWYDANSGATTHPVGQKKPNGWGVYDMHGNVWEWCQDTGHDSYDGAPSNGSAWESPAGSLRVIRGGGWGLNAQNCRSSFRYIIIPDYTLNFIGFRVSRTP
jgi:formylglycine-generating enzyme required for sulfatase activity